MMVLEGSTYTGPRRFDVHAAQGPNGVVMTRTWNGQADDSWRFVCWKLLPHDSLVQRLYRACRNPNQDGAILERLRCARELKK